MAVYAAQLITKVAAEGVEDTKRQLSDVGKTTEETKHHFEGLKNALSFAGGQLLFGGLTGGFSFLKDQLGQALQQSKDAQAGMANTVKVLQSTHDASGMTATAVGDLATKFSHLTMFQDDTVQSAENMLLTFTNIGKKGGVFDQATQTTLDMSQALGQDTKSSAIQLGKALNDPIAGISALSRVGVTFDAQQKQSIKTFMAHNDVISAQKVILTELSREFGGQAVAAGKTFDGQMAILGQTMDDLRQNIGDALLPLLTKFAGVISTYVVPVISKFADAFTSFIVGSFDKLAPIVEQAQKAFQAVFEPIKQVHQAAQPLFDTFDRMSGVFQATLHAVKPLTDTFDRASGLITSTSLAAKPLLDTFDRASAVIPATTVHVQALSSYINPLIPTFQMLHAVFEQDVLPAFNKFTSWIHDTALPALGRFGDWFAHTALPVILHLGENIKQNLLPPLERLIGNVITSAMKFGDWVFQSGALKNVLDPLIGIVGGIAGKLADFVGWMNKGGPATDAVKVAILGIGGALLAVKIADFGKSVYKTFSDSVDNVKTFINTLGKIKDTAGDVLGFFKDKFSPGAKGAIEDVGTSAETTTGEVASIGVAAETDVGEVEGASIKEEASLATVGKSGDAASLGVKGIGAAALGAVTAVGGLAIAMGSLAMWLHDSGIVPDVAKITGGHDINPGWVTHRPPTAHAAGIFNSPTGHMASLAEQGDEWMHIPNPTVGYVPQGASVLPHGMSPSALGGGGGRNAQQPIILVMDGRQVGHGLMPHIVNNIRNATGVRF